MDESRLAEIDAAAMRGQGCSAADAVALVGEIQRLNRALRLSELSRGMPTYAAADAGTRYRDYPTVGRG